jgi:hypothetical protein
MIMLEQEPYRRMSAG